MQKRKSGIAKVTGWIDAPALVAVHGYARYPSASSPAALSEPRCRRASQNTGSAPSDTMTICARASTSGDGHSTHSGARRTRNGSTCAAEPRHLLARRAVRDLERSAMRRAPDGLHHVPEVEPPLEEVHVAAVNDHEQDGRPSGHRDPDGERPRAVADERVARSPGPTRTLRPSRLLMPAPRQAGSQLGSHARRGLRERRARSSRVRRTASTRSRRASGGRSRA